MHQSYPHDVERRESAEIIPFRPAKIEDIDAGKAERLSDEAFTLAFYASVAVAGLLSLVGTVAYGYLLILDLL